MKKMDSTQNKGERSEKKNEDMHDKYDKYSGSYGYNDPLLVDKTNEGWTAKKTIALILALTLIFAFWLALDQKLLFGKDWISNTYDNPDWRTNEGNLHTFGAWDIETHIWKTDYVLNNFPNFQWNPYWYLGMPLLKYYQSGFYFLNIGFMEIFTIDAARATLLLVIFGHLLATLLTFLLCYKVSRKIWISALASLFLLSNTFISLRSYGWEPITVVFLFLYPLGLYLFLKEPLKPFRFWLILVLGVAYLSHPLIWFSLCLFMGLYLLSIALRKNISKEAQTRHYIWQFVGIVILSLLIGALQFLPQLSYQQVTSGAHMGVKYLPFYQVPPNIISLKDFFFDIGNLKGPGPIIMIAVLLLIIFAYLQYIRKNKNKNHSVNSYDKKKLHTHELIAGLAIVLLVMVLFYYLERYNIFPMNILRSIQYHRIIPEFLITAAVLVAALSAMTRTYKQKVVYYSLLIAFVAASGIIIYFVQTHWVTSSDISSKPEFINDTIQGRISMPYTDQSLAVRNSFTNQYQVYGYYEQGITNPYADELFSVSSGYHNANLTILYLKAANVARLYVNTEEGDRDKIVIERLNGTLLYVHNAGDRYAYFQIPLANPSFAQAVDGLQAESVQKLEPGCRVMFKDTYCGSVGEEFVSTDSAEIKYLAAYVNLTQTPYGSNTTYTAYNPNIDAASSRVTIQNINVTMTMHDPDHYTISVRNATVTTAIIVKMTHDSGFSASVNGKKLRITSIGPDFMLISPNMQGNYDIKLSYGIGKVAYIGAIISILSVLGLSVYFIVRKIRGESKGRARKKETLFDNSKEYVFFKKGDMK
jgi:hypothetical protein